MKRKQTRRMNFTESKLGALTAPTATVKIYDSQVKDLGLKLLPTGKRVWFWFRTVPNEYQPQKAGKATWKTLGEFPALSISDARERALDLSTRLARWRASGCPHPSPFTREERPEEWTFSQAAEDFFARHLRTRAQRPEAAERDQRYRLNKHLAVWSSRPLSSIMRRDVQELHKKIGESSGHYAANAVVVLVRRVFNFAINTEQFTGENPASKIECYREEKRARFLQREELPRLFAALAAEKNQDLVHFVQISLWTGARKSDVLSMRWRNLSLADNRWNVSDPKGGEAYQVALTPEAVGILTRRKNASEFVFPSDSKSGHVMDLHRPWRELLKRAKITDFRMHDLRRTLASWQAQQGTSLLVIGKSLGHRSLASTQIYARLTLQPVRESVNAAAQEMLRASKKQLPAVTTK